MSGFCRPNRGPATGTPAPKILALNIGNDTSHYTGFNAYYREPDLVHVVINYDMDWVGAQNVNWIFDNMATIGYKKKMLFTAPLMLSGVATPNNTTLAAAANGDYDAYYYGAAANIISRMNSDGLTPPVIIRPGVEHNGTWMPWSPAIGSEATFATAFQKLVTQYRAAATAASKPSDYFRFEWNVNIGNTWHGGSGINLNTSYPGSSYVDYIGMDFYVSTANYSSTNPAVIWSEILAGTSYGGNGLTWLASFASGKGKPVAFSEWGIGAFMDYSNPPTSLDTSIADAKVFAEAYGAALMDSMSAWCSDPANDVAYEMIWGRDEGFYGYFFDGGEPNCAAAYKLRFPAAGIAGGP